MQLRNFRGLSGLSWRIFAQWLLGAAMLTGVLGLIWASSQRSSQTMEYLVYDSAPQVQRTQMAALGLLNAQNTLREFAIWKMQSGDATVAGQIADRLNTILAELDALSTAGAYPPEQYAEYRSKIDRAADMLQKSPQMAILFLNQATPAFEALNTSLSADLDRAIAERDSATQEALHAQSLTTYVLMGLCGTIALIGLVAGVLRTRRTEQLAQESRMAREKQAQDEKAIAEISKVVQACAVGDFTQRLSRDDKSGVLAELCEQVNLIGEAAMTGLEPVHEALSALSRQDLTHRMPTNLKGIFKQIAEALDLTVDDLNKVLREVADKASYAKTATDNISETSRALARQSELNANRLQETSAEVEAITGSVRQMADSAAEAKTEVDDISHKAAQGQQLLDRAQNAMDDIMRSSDLIAQAVGVIDSISFQTSLLALNAGVEAARAGESGSGFAVVASEVRILSKQASESAQNISKLVEESRTMVENGVRAVRETGHAFSEIVEGVGHTAQQIGKFSSGTTEIAQGAENINQATQQLDHAAQVNAAALEETTASLDELSGIVSDFAGTAARFNLKTTAGDGKTTPPRIQPMLDVA